MNLITESTYTESYGNMAYIIKARMQLMRDFGVYPAAHSAFLLNMGLETLPVRMKQYCENAMTVAKYLEASPAVEKVNYPGLESDVCHALAEKYLKGCSGVISFIIKGGRPAAAKFMNHCIWHPMKYMLLIFVRVCFILHQRHTVS